MEDSIRPFDDTLDMVIEQEAQKLALGAAAEAAGYYQNPSVEEECRRLERDGLIEAYLREAVVSKITFNRAEFQEFYDENIDKFRGPEEVLLDVLVISDEATAMDFAQRLAEGADFDFLRNQFGLGSDNTSGKASWGPKEMLSAEIEAEIDRMEIGQGSAAIPITTGWMVFQLEGRRPGRPKSLEEVELTIRGVIFQRKFNEYLDEHLALLKERSEIVIEQDAVDAYFGS